MAKTITQIKEEKKLHDSNAASMPVAGAITGAATGAGLKAASDMPGSVRMTVNKHNGLVTTKPASKFHIARSKSIEDAAIRIKARRSIKDGMFKGTMLGTVAGTAAAALYSRAMIGKRKKELAARRAELKGNN